MAFVGVCCLLTFLGGICHWHSVAFVFHLYFLQAFGIGVCWHSVAFSGVCCLPIFLGDICYWRSLAFGGVCWRSVAFVGVQWRLLACSGICWRSVAFGGVQWRLLFSNIFGRHLLLAFVGICWRSVAFVGVCLLVRPLYYISRQINKYKIDIVRKICVLAFGKCIIYYNQTTGSIYLDRVKCGEETAKSAVFKMADLKMCEVISFALVLKRSFQQQNKFILKNEIDILIP